MAGTSPSDFFLRATDGTIHHHRDGEWVVEGPQGNPNAESGTNDDRFKIFADGTIMFQTTPEGSGSRFTYVYGNECWAQSNSGALGSADLVARDGVPAFAYEESFGDLCFVAVR